MKERDYFSSLNWNQKQCNPSPQSFISSVPHEGLAAGSVTLRDLSQGSVATVRRLVPPQGPVWGTLGFLILVETKGPLLVFVHLCDCLELLV